VTSNLNGLVEIAGDAAVHVDPDDPGEIANAVEQVLSNHELRESLVRRGLKRSREFTWERCGRKTLEIIETVGAATAHPQAKRTPSQQIS
jgi:glycosyltransferase involved in cell wall biosynthesis